MAQFWTAGSCIYKEAPKNTLLYGHPLFTKWMMTFKCQLDFRQTLVYPLVLFITELILVCAAIIDYCNEKETAQRTSQIIDYNDQLSHLLPDFRTNFACLCIFVSCSVHRHKRWNKLGGGLFRCDGLSAKNWQNHIGFCISSIPFRWFHQYENISNMLLVTEIRNSRIMHKNCMNTFNQTLHNNID